MRIALGAFSHEANTFAPRLTTRADFAAQRLKYGHDMLAGLEGTADEETGALGVLASEPTCEVVPLLAARALSGGPLVGADFRALRDEFVARLRAALPVDGVLLVLHGAMLAEGEPDATGELLRALRAVVGAAVPIVGTLDLHANVTARMAREATALIGYHTAPHIDMFAAGQTAARLLLRTLQGACKPSMALARLPMLIPAENARHTDGPLSEVINQALALERSGAILHGGIYPVQPWLDTEDMACSVVVVTDHDALAARSHADTLARAFWQRRAAFVPELVAPDEAFRRAAARASGTIVFCDSADAPTSGSTGDSTTLLRAALRAAPFEQLVLLNIVDAPAVAQAVAAGVGAEVSVPVGGGLAPQYYAPVTFTGRVRLISDGVFRATGASMSGATHHMGRTVVLTRGGLHLVVMERAVSQWDPHIYISVGEEPRAARVVQVKSPAGFRAAYQGIADDVYIIDAPGIASPKLTALDWKHLPRPIYPLDPEVTYP
jgi:microcystin degradation protein MlrC